jgi:hypothetical protein
MVTNTEQFIDCNFNLPNHTNELSKAEEVIGKLKDKIDNHSKLKNINNNSHDSLYDEVCRVLDYLGRLSTPVFNVQDRMEEMYTLQYKHCPALGKKLWLTHYENVHHPYNILKNRCFRLLELLDEIYIKKFKHTPPNWNI